MEEDPIANYVPEDLDKFLRDIYNYYEKCGYASMLAFHSQRVCTALLTGVFSFLVLVVIDWSSLSKCTPKDCQISYLIHKDLFSRLFSLWGLPITVVCSAAILTLVFLVSAYQDLTSAKFIKRIYSHPSWLGIPNSKALLMMEWPTIAARLSLRQQSRPFHHKCTSLSALDIANIITRRDNMMTMLANSGALEAYAPSWFPRRLLYSEPLIMLMSAVLIGTVLDRPWKVGSNFHSLVISSKWSIRMWGLTLLILTPAVLVLSLAYLLMRDAHAIRGGASNSSSSKASGVAGAGKTVVDAEAARTGGVYVWSKEARLKLRQYCELPHFFESRLERARKEIDPLMKLKWKSALVRAIAKISLFAAGTYLALLVIIGLVEDKALFDISLGGKQLVFHMAATGAVVAFLTSLQVGSGGRDEDDLIDSTSIFSKTIALSQHVLTIPPWVLGRGESCRQQRASTKRAKSKVPVSEFFYVADDRKYADEILDELDEPFWQRSVVRQGLFNDGLSNTFEQPLIRLIMNDLKKGKIGLACRRVSQRISWNVNISLQHEEELLDEREREQRVVQGNFLTSNHLKTDNTNHEESTFHNHHEEGISDGLDDTNFIHNPKHLECGRLPSNNNNNNSPNFEVFPSPFAGGGHTKQPILHHPAFDTHSKDFPVHRRPSQDSEEEEERETHRNMQGYQSKQSPTKILQKSQQPTSPILGAGLDWILIDPLSTLGADLYETDQAFSPTNFSDSNENLFEKVSNNFGGAPHESALLESPLSSPKTNHLFNPTPPLPQRMQRKQAEAATRLSASAGVSAARLMDAHLDNISNIEQSLATSKGLQLLWEVASILTAPLVILFILPRSTHALLAVLVNGCIQHSSLGVIAAGGLLDVSVSGGVSWGGQAADVRKRFSHPNPSPSVNGKEEKKEKSECSQECVVEELPPHLRKKRLSPSLPSSLSSAENQQGFVSPYLPSLSVALNLIRSSYETPAHPTLANGMDGVYLPPASELPRLQTEGLKVITSALSFALSYRIPANPLAIAVASQKSISTGRVNDTMLRRRDHLKASIPPKLPPPEFAMRISQLSHQQFEKSKRNSGSSSDAVVINGDFIPVGEPSPITLTNTRQQQLLPLSPTAVSQTATNSPIAPQKPIPIWGYSSEVLCLLVRLSKFQFLMQTRSREMKILLDMMPDSVAAAAVCHATPTPPPGVNLTEYADHLASSFAQRMAGIANPNLPFYGYEDLNGGFNERPSSFVSTNNSKSNFQLLPATLDASHFNSKTNQSDLNNSTVKKQNSSHAVPLVGPELNQNEKNAQLEAEVLKLIFHSCRTDTASSKCDCEYINSMSQCVEHQWGGNERAWAVSLEPASQNTMPSLMFWLTRWHSVAREVLARHILDMKRATDDHDN
eukprot:GDKK01031590.1.p1 GENE.GDKK01031590.1~~GDKK01031590.1.p1  ORF type:complete len:1386 (-),score=281.95 GDKK01031590.1:73-4230(-)